MSPIRHHLIALLFLAAIAGKAAAQTQFVGTTNFPAELEFNELHEIKSDIRITEASALSKIGDGLLFAQAGFSEYLARSYALPNKQTLVLEDVTLEDSRAAYSLSTLLRKADLQQGPPGDVYSVDGGSLLFTQGTHFIRIEGGGSSNDLLRRVATSISNRIGPGDPSLPLLIKHFPEDGMKPSTLYYFLGPFSSDAYSPVIDGKSFKSELDMDIAQADYVIGTQHGKLSLINFPTIQLAEDYFDNLGGPGNSEGRSVYLKRAGPLVGILEGSFDRTDAVSILKPVQFRYSVRWIYDKSNRSSGAVMGIPVGILGTVVRSIVLTGLLCGVSILTGAGIAAFRLLLRKYAPNNYLDRPERTEIIRLKIDEN
jgi:hypothetical protein